MTDLTHSEDTRGIGDNIPPDPIAEFRNSITEGEAYCDIKNRVNGQKVGLHKVPEEVTADNVAVVSDFMGQCIKIDRTAEALRKELKKPHDDRGKVVQALLGPQSVFRMTLAELMKPVQARLDAFRQKQEREEQARLAKLEEEKRREAELKRREAERLEEEARQAAIKAETEADRPRAAALIERQEEATEGAAMAEKVADVAGRQKDKPVSIKGPYGSTTFGRTVRTFEILNDRTINMATLWPFIDAECKERAIRAAVKASIPEVRFGKGVRFFDKKSSVTRA